MIIAIAMAETDADNDTLAKGHFGSAPQFRLFKMDATSVTYLRSVDNPRGPASPEGPDAHSHEGHHHGQGDGHQGHGIGRLLGDEGVQVMVSRAFGANIKRMRQRFLPVVVRSERVDDAVAMLQAHWVQIEQHWNQGSERKHLVLRG